MAATFSLLHVREAQSRERPGAKALLEHLLGDTLGAALTRAVDGTDVAELSRFLKGRLREIERSLARLKVAIHRVRKAVARESGRASSGEGRQPGDRLHATLEWFETNVPGLSDGTLPSDERALLQSDDVVDEIARVASSLLAGMEARDGQRG